MPKHIKMITKQSTGMAAITSHVFFGSVKLGLLDTKGSGDESMET
jgi:hypothetical protein